MAQNIKPLLTIAIPTYNRSQYLGLCLDHICSQLTALVKVVVRDNHSYNYDVDAFMKPYIDKYNVSLYKNPINVGGDANIAKLFEFCETQWLWVIGDDDYIRSDAINVVLDIINKHSDAIYIKFNSLYKGKVQGLKGFAEAMTPHTAFAYSFFTSECVFNMNNNEEDIYYHYQALSSYSGQIIRVMKHLILHDEARCLFLDIPILEEHGGDVSWNRIDIVPQQLFLIYEFWDQRDILRNNVFKDIANYCLVYIDSSDLSLSKKLHYYFMLIKTCGVMNLLRYNKVSIIRIPLRLLLSKKMYLRIKRIFRKR